MRSCFRRFEGWDTVLSGTGRRRESDGRGVILAFGESRESVGVVLGYCRLIFRFLVEADGLYICVVGGKLGCCVFLVGLSFFLVFSYFCSFGFF